VGGEGEGDEGEVGGAWEGEWGCWVFCRGGVTPWRRSHIQAEDLAFSQIPLPAVGRVGMFTHGSPKRDWSTLAGHW
jgi:hypothetical protein